VETDACDSGAGVVLMQEGWPLACISQGLAPKHLGLSVYEKELIAMLVEVDRWRHYFENNTFIICTDHESLQFLLQQRLHTHLQRKRVSNLLGLDYTIQYRKGKENMVADALSRGEENGSYKVVTIVTPEWIKEVVDRYVNIVYLRS